ncbi:MAG: major capsid protein [Candidatus Gastranaerophilales bacterium]|nr:major capsid protein [Candidatus Gastranaerophilales bacterium]
MGRLEELRINAYLSEVARGYSNNTFIAENLFPVIDSEKEKIDIFEFNKEAFTVYDTERAIRANSNVISPKGFTKHTATLSEHDLSYPIDYREEQEAEKVKLQVHATNVVTQGLKLKHEKQCADLVQNPDNYPDTNKITLSGTSQFNDESSDPVSVIDDAKDKVCEQIGQDPNTLILGQDVWTALKRNESLKKMIASTSNKIVTIDLLKEFFEVENIFIGKAIYTNQNNKFERVWGKNAILAFVPHLTSRTEYDPAFAYTV